MDISKLWPTKKEIREQLENLKCESLKNRKEYDCYIERKTEIDRENEIRSKNVQKSLENMDGLINDFKLVVY